MYTNIVGAIMDVWTREVCLALQKHPRLPIRMRTLARVSCRVFQNYVFNGFLWYAVLSLKMTWKYFNTPNDDDKRRYRCKLNVDWVAREDPYAVEMP